jgi:hypothetical protein
MVTENMLFTLSDIQLIDNKRLHPHAAEAHQRMKAATDKFDITLPSFFEYASMSSFIFPDASMRRLLAIGLINNLLFYIDDTFDRNNPSNKMNKFERRDLFEQCFKVLKTGIMPISAHENILRACLEIHSVMRDTAPHRDWLPRILRNLMHHLNASTYDADDIIRDQDPICAYIALRELDSGMEAEINFIEYAYNMFLPDWVLQHEEVAQATLMCSRIGGLMNDIFSYEKEVLTHHSRFNLLAVLQEVDHIPFSEALDYAVRILNEYTATFIEMYQHIPRFDDPAVNRNLALYYEGLANMINGTWHWQISTNRYRSHTSPFRELRGYLAVEA